MKMEKYYACAAPAAGCCALPEHGSLYTDASRVFPVSETQTPETAASEKARRGG